MKERPTMKKVLKKTLILSALALTAPPSGAWATSDVPSVSPSDTRTTGLQDLGRPHSSRSGTIHVRNFELGGELQYSVREDGATAQGAAIRAHLPVALFSTDQGRNRMAGSYGVFNLGGEFRFERDPTKPTSGILGADVLEIHSPQFSLLQAVDRSGNRRRESGLNFEVRGLNVGYSLEKDSRVESKAQGVRASLLEASFHSATLAGSIPLELCGTLQAMEFVSGDIKIQGDQSDSGVSFFNGSLCGAIQLGKVRLSNTTEFEMIRGKEVETGEVQPGTSQPIREYASAHQVANTTRLDFVSDENLKLGVGYTLTHIESENALKSRDSSILSHTVSVGGAW